MRLQFEDERLGVHEIFVTPVNYRKPVNYRIEVYVHADTINPNRFLRHIFTTKFSYIY